MKEIDLSATIYDLTEAYPELIELLKELGFFGVTRPVVRSTLGRATTLVQGCDKQGKDLAEVVRNLERHGFAVTSRGEP